ncbi:MAG: DUF1989 domain-containing protein, partial [Rhodobacteraceae bacterium]|nr:DUF1989 domain-containing protein [Paracoccaceae bacterium]
MKYQAQNTAPIDAKSRRSAEPVVCYPIDTLPAPDMALYSSARQNMTLIDTVIMPPRAAKCFHVPAGHFFRIISVDGPQVGDLNL